MTKQELDNAALNRAVRSDSEMNIGTIYAGFIDKGIRDVDIQPRVNIFTYAAWRAKGRQVQRGEKGVRISTWIPYKCKKTGENKMRPKATSVFHVSQTQAMA